MVGDVMSYDADLKSMFAAHSARRGADFHRFINGMPLEMRMELGDWSSPSVEAAYRACDYRRMMEAAAGFQL